MTLGCVKWTKLTRSVLAETLESPYTSGRVYINNTILKDSSEVFTRHTLRSGNFPLGINSAGIPKYETEITHKEVDKYQTHGEASNVHQAPKLLRCVELRITPSQGPRCEEWECYAVSGEKFKADKTGL